jgi:NCS1 family nucleobase:cation symporter-1
LSQYFPLLQVATSSTLSPLTEANKHFLVYYSCASAIVISDFWIVRKKLLKVPDLFTPGGIYWYTAGWNWRCMVALILGMAPSLPGFFMICIDSSTQNAAVAIFQVCWFVGAPLSFVIFIGLNNIWPPEGLGVSELISEDDMPQVIEGVDSAREKSSAPVTEKDSEQQNICKDV